MKMEKPRSTAIRNHKLKDGRRLLAYKAENAVDMAPGASSM